MMAKSFQETIRRFVDQSGWETIVLTDDSAEIEFENEDGYTLTLYLQHDEDELIFSIPSIASFEHPEDIPDFVSTYLLKRNIFARTGFWALKELEDGWAYILYHDQKLSNQDFEIDISAKAFHQIVQSMICEVEEFDDWWEEENW